MRYRDGTHKVLRKIGKIEIDNQRPAKDMGEQITTKKEINEIKKA